MKTPTLIAMTALLALSSLSSALASEENPAGLAAKLRGAGSDGTRGNDPDKQGHSTPVRNMKQIASCRSDKAAVDILFTTNADGVLGFSTVSKPDDSPVLFELARFTLGAKREAVAPADQIKVLREAIEQKALVVVDGRNKSGGELTLTLNAPEENRNQLTDRGEVLPLACTLIAR
jgi:hypothetical protein